MSKFNIGDRVVITNSGKEYTNYNEWVKTYAREYLDDFLNTNFEHSISRAVSGTILARGEHLEWSAKSRLYLIKTDGDNVVLMGEDGIQLERVYEKENKIPIKPYELFEYYLNDNNKNKRFIDADGDIYYYDDESIKLIVRANDTISDMTNNISSYLMYKLNIAPYIDKKKMTQAEIEKELGYQIEIVEDVCNA